MRQNLFKRGQSLQSAEVAATQILVMTQRYAHHYSERLRDGVETLDRISTILAQSNVVGEVKPALQALE
jgi:hypothetical protein